MSDSLLTQFIKELGTDPTKLDKLFDKITISYEKYLQNRQQLTEASTQNILKTEEELAKKIAELQAEQEKMALEKKIKTEKDKEERIKLKTEAAQKEFEIQKGLLDKTFEIDKEALTRKMDLIKAANTGIIDQNELMQKLNEKYAVDSLKLEQDLKQKKLQIVQEETEQIKKKYETTFSTIGKTITKISSVLDGNLGKTVSNFGTAIDKIGTTIASAKKLTLTEALTSSVDFITNTVKVYKNGNKNVSGWDLINNTLNGAMLGSQIGSAIPVVGSTIGAVAGAGVDFASTIFGWLFGGGARKLQRELTTIGQIDKMVQANVNALSNRTNQLASTAGSGKFLEELNGQIGQINEQLGYISGQEVYEQQIYNPSQYKKAGARAQAQADLSAAMTNLASQKAELANAMNAVAAAIAQRKQEIAQGGQDLTMQLDELLATNTGNTSLAIDTKLFEEDLKSVAELNSNLYNWHDSPENMALAQQIREQQLVAMGKERKLAWVTAQKEAELFAQKMAEADLYAQNDGNPDAVAIAKFNKEKAIKDLELEVQQLMIQYESDTEKLVELAKYRADRMTAIAAEEQEAIENSLTSTATQFSDLLDQYDAVATQFDFQRKKTQEETQEEDLEKLKAKVREEYPEFMAMLDSIGTDNPIKVDSSNFFDSVSFRDALSNISKHTASNTWNNVINIDVQGNNAQDLAESINMQLKKLLDDQKRFTNW